MTTPAPAEYIDDAVVEPGKAYVFYAPVGSPAPTFADVEAFDPETPAILSTRNGMNVWDTGGHTDLDEDFDADQDGGDSESRGSRQNPSLRERVEATVEYLQLNLIEFGRKSAYLYYGGGKTTAVGEFDAPDSPTPRPYATCVVYVDGEDRKVAEYHPKTSVRGNGAIARAADGFLRFPIRFTWQKLAGQPVTRLLGEHFGGELDLEDDGE